MVGFPIVFAALVGVALLMVAWQLRGTSPSLRRATRRGDVAWSGSGSDADCASADGGCDGGSD
jgi:hypothetical protein